MITEISNLINFISNIIKNASKLFKFRNYTNNCSNRKIDNLFDADMCKNTKKTIDCKDLLYFTCLQSKDNKP
jgi:hypothetical protein